MSKTNHFQCTHSVPIATALFHSNKSLSLVFFRLGSFFFSSFFSQQEPSRNRVDVANSVSPSSPVVVAPGNVATPDRLLQQQTLPGEAPPPPPQGRGNYPANINPLVWDSLYPQIRSAPPPPPSRCIEGFVETQPQPAGLALQEPDGSQSTNDDEHLHSFDTEFINEIALADTR